MSAASPPDVSVVVVSFNTRDVLRECLQTLVREAGGVRYETIVVDNASRDGSADMVEQEFPEATLIRSGVNLGFAAANNRGFAIAKGRYVVALETARMFDNIDGAVMTPEQYIAFVRSAWSLIGVSGGGK